MHEEGFLVQVATESPETNNAIKMEVGIEDCLHIEFEYNKSKYHLQDVVLGKIFFLLARLAANPPSRAGPRASLSERLPVAGSNKDQEHGARDHSERIDREGRDHVQ